MTGGLKARPRTFPASSAVAARPGAAGQRRRKTRNGGGIARFSPSVIAPPTRGRWGRAETLIFPWELTMTEAEQPHDLSLWH